MSQACTFSQSYRQNDTDIVVSTWSWTSDSSGDVSGTVGTSTAAISGEILRCVTNPGSAAPSANYDIVINDADGIDVLAGQGANRHTTTSEHVKPGVPFKDGTTTSTAPVCVNGTLTLVVSNAGDSKNGTVVLYTR